MDFEREKKKCEYRQSLVALASRFHLSSWSPPASSLGGCVWCSVNLANRCGEQNRYRPPEPSDQGPGGLSLSLNIIGSWD